MLFLFDFDLHALAAVGAVLLLLFEISLFGLQNANGGNASIATCAGAGVHGFLTSWHS